MASDLQQELKQTRSFRSPEEEAYLSIQRTAAILEHAFESELKEFGITATQYNVLRILRGAHPETLPTLEIAARMLEKTPGITRLLDRLEAKRLVGRDRGRDDRRRVHVRILPDGLALLARLDAPMLTAAAEGFRELDRAELAGLSRLLDRVRAGLRGRRGPPPG